MGFDLRTPEGDALIDLRSPVEGEILRLLLKPVLRRYVNLFLFSADSLQIALWPSPHRSKKWIAQDLVKICEYRNLDLPRLFQEVGYSLDLFSENELEEMRRYTQEKWRLLSAELEKVLDSMGEERMKEQTSIFLELALHSREDVTTFLKVAHRLASRLKTDWPGMVAMHSQWKKDYEKQIRGLVEARGGSVPFDEYYHLAMFEPLHGVYTGQTAKDLIGEHSDSFFITSSENKVFQKTMAYALRPLWEGLGRPDLFEVVEMGAGNGTLAEGILEGVQNLSGQDPSWKKLQEALRYHVVEISPALAEKQRGRLARFGSKVTHHIQSAVHAPLPRVKAGLFLSNELIDMFSPTKLVHFEDELYEVYVSSFGGMLQERLGPVRLETRQFLDRHSLTIDPGELFYVQREIDPWVENIQGNLERGYVLTLDYGNRRQALRDMRNDYWLRPFFGIRSNGGLRKAIEWFSEIARKTDFPFNDQLSTYMDSPTGVGEPKDMTLFIDFNTLEEAALQTRAVRPIDLMTQGDFLYLIEQWAEKKGEGDGSFLKVENETALDRDKLLYHYGKFRISIMGKGVEPVNPFIIPPSHLSP